MYDEYYGPASPQDAIREWAWQAGQEPHYINDQWLCHPSFADAWTENPHYKGEPQLHPMMDCEEDYK